MHPIVDARSRLRRQGAAYSINQTGKPKELDNIMRNVEFDWDAAWQCCAASWIARSAQPRDAAATRECSCPLRPNRIGRLLQSALRKQVLPRPGHALSRTAGHAGRLSIVRIPREPLPCAVLKMAAATRASSTPARNRVQASASAPKNLRGSVGALSPANRESLCRTER